MIRLIATSVAMAWLAGAAPRAISAPPAAAAVAPIAFDFVHDQQILFPTTINGHRAEAWLDSGASATVVDAAFARQIGLPPGVPVAANGVSGRISGAYMTLVQMATGGAAPTPRAAVVMDMAAVAAAVDRPVQVILGRDVFDASVVDIDFAGRQLRLIPREAFQPPAAPPLPLKPSGTLHSIPILVEGRPMEAVVDLGHAGALMIDRKTADRLGLAPGAHASTEIGVGADGPREHVVASLGPVQVAGLNLRGVPTTFVDQLSSRAPANVGLQILSRFEVILDFKGERAWLLPNRNVAEAGFRKNRSGLAANRAGNHLSVVHVAPGSPAAAAGWKVGEAIAAIDGEAIGPGYGASGAWGFSYRPAGSTVRFTMADGTRRSLTLGDYY